MRTGLIKMLSDHVQQDGSMFRWQYLVLEREEVEALMAGDSKIVDDISVLARQNSIVAEEFRS